jgi:hypothetical protein
MSKRYFHGGPHALTNIDAARRNDDGFLICLTASVNVAQRYGSVVMEFSLEAEDVLTITPREWADNDPRIDGGEAIVVVSGHEESFDFPVDVLHVRLRDAVKILGVLPEADLKALNDGLATKPRRRNCSTPARWDNRPSSKESKHEAHRRRGLDGADKSDALSRTESRRHW